MFATVPAAEWSSFPYFFFSPNWTTPRSRSFNASALSVFSWQFCNTRMRMWPVEVYLMASNSSARANVSSRVFGWLSNSSRWSSTSVTSYTNDSPASCSRKVLLGYVILKLCMLNLLVMSVTRAHLQTWHQIIIRVVWLYVWRYRLKNMRASPRKIISLLSFLQSSSFKLSLIRRPRNFHDFHFVFTFFLKLL